MSVPYPTLVIDTDSALAERVRGLLQQAGIRGIRSGVAQSGDRLLVVDASAAQLKQARKAGAQHVVHVQQASALLRGGGLHEAESEARLSWLQAQLYFEGLLPRIALSLATGRFVSAAPARRAAYIAHDDAAIAAAALLASDVQTGRKLALTGPAALSHAEVCALVAEDFSRTIDVEQVSMEALLPELQRRGLSSVEAHISLELDQALLRELPEVSHDTSKITGMAPLSAAAILTRVRAPLLAMAEELRLPAIARDERREQRIWSCSAQA